jgi:type IV pilus assembly protein PilM
MSSWLASPPPDAAIEISPDAVAVATVGVRGREPFVQSYAVEPLPAGAATAALTSRNIVDRPGVVQALRSALDRAGIRPRRVALVIPDSSARVSLIRFDRVPERREDLDQLVRWQIRKAAPFPVEEAALSYSPGLRSSDGGGEFVTVMARQDIVREYEEVCEEIGLYPGLVDLATLSVLNLFLASGPPPGDWLAVHMRPEYVSIAVMRGEHMIFFRTRSEGDDVALVDLVHQTTMYYQDRLSGQGFVRVLFGGMARPADTFDAAQRMIEDRLELRVETIDPTRIAALTDRLTPGVELTAALSPLVGILLRTRREAVAA